MKLIKWILHTTLALLSLSFIIVLFFTITAPGLRASFALASYFTHGALSAEGVKGRLIRDFEIKHLSYHDKKHSLSLENLTLNWRPLRLLFGKLDIREFSLAKGEIKLPEDSKTNTSTDAEKERKPSSHSSQLPQHNPQHDFEAMLDQGKITLPVIHLPIKLHLETTDIQNLEITLIHKDDDDTVYKINQLKFNKLDLNDKHLAVRDFVFNLPLYRGHANAQVAFKAPYAMSLNAQILASFPGFDPLDSKLSIQGSLNDTLTIHLSSPAPYATNIAAVFKKPLELGPCDVKAHWENFILPGNESFTLISEQGQINLTGTLKNYNLAIKTKIAGLNVPTGTWELQGQGTPKNLTLTKIQSNTLGGQFLGQLKLGWLPALTWDGKLAGTNLNPGLEWRNFEGNINFNATTLGSLAKKANTFELHLNSLTGNLHTHQLSGRIHAQYKKDALLITQSHLTIGDDGITLKGQLGKNWQFAWSLNSPDLSELYPAATGSIKASGTITGPHDTPLIITRLAMNDLYFQRLYIKTLDLKSQLNFKPNAYSNLRLNLAHLRYYHHRILGLDFSLNGLIGKENFQLKLQTPKQNLTLKANAHCTDKRWNGKLNALTMTSKTFGNWHLEKPAAMTLTEKAAMVQNFKWLSNQKGEVALNLNLHQGKDSTALLHIQHLPASLFETLYTDNLTLNTFLHLDANLKITQDDELLGQVSFGTTPGYMVYQNFKTPFQNISAKARVGGDGLSMNALIQTQNNTPLNATVSLPQYHSLDQPLIIQPIKGQIALNLQNLKVLPLFVPDLDIADGALKGQVNLKGRILKPIFEGSLVLSHAKAFIHPLGILLTQIELLLKGDDQGNIHIKGSLNSDKGTLTLKGQTTTTNPSFSSLLTAQGENLLVYNMDGYKIYASPNITIKYNRPKMTIDGSVLIPKALIEPTDFTSVVTLPSNVIVTKDDEAIDTPLFNIYTTLKITLSKDITFNYAGLSAQLTGGLTLYSAPEQLTTAVGQLNVVKGKYDAYGAKLNIDYGALLFAGGPISNPGLNIQASKRVKYVSQSSFSSRADPNQSFSLASTIDTITVGVKVTGTAKNPQINLFSEPGGLSDGNILSYIVLGVSMQNASQAQGAMLNTAAQALGFKGDSVLNQIQSVFGLTEFGMTNETYYGDDNSPKQTTAFAIGKYITPKIYLHYSAGIGSNFNILYVRYLMTKRISLQTDANTRGTGADIFYSFETD